MPELGKDRKLGQAFEKQDVIRAMAEGHEFGSRILNEHGWTDGREKKELNFEDAEPGDLLTKKMETSLPLAASPFRKPPQKQ